STEVDMDARQLRPGGRRLQTLGNKPRLEVQALTIVGYRSRGFPPAEQGPAHEVVGERQILSVSDDLRILRGKLLAQIEGTLRVHSCRFVVAQVVQSPGQVHEDLSQVGPVLWLPGIIGGKLLSQGQ